MLTLLTDDIWVSNSLYDQHPSILTEFLGIDVWCRRFGLFMLLSCSVLWRCEDYWVRVFGRQILHYGEIKYKYPILFLEDMYITICSNRSILLFTVASMFRFFSLSAHQLWIAVHFCRNMKLSVERKMDACGFWTWDLQGWFWKGM